ncbi:ABC transporter ATP-binding protein/permease, partial [Candidatus Woesearchaeota archaeon]|nr:ABC transporter ATP-binding protein/permease [Candidatus Woesearchaeota archaeon]
MKKKRNGFINKTYRVLRFARPYWKTMIVLFIISVGLSAISIVNPYLIKILIDDIFIAKNYGLLVALMLVFVFIFFLKTIVGIYHSYKSQWLAENIVLGVKQRLFEHLERLDLGFFSRKKLGDILIRLDDDVYGVEDFIGILIDDILMSVLTGSFILGICLYLNWKVTLSALCFFPFYVVSQKYYGKKVKKQRQKLLRLSSNFLSFLQESMSSIRAIKAFVLEKMALSKYTRQSKKLIREDLKLTLIEGYSGSIVGLITFTPLLIILWYGGFKVITGALTIGSLMALYTYVGKLFGPVSTLGSINIAIQSTLVSVNRVFQYLDEKPKIKEKPNAKIIKNVKGSIEFKDVMFQYNPKEPVLEKISFKIKPGEKIGLIGPSGSGKSTIANLLCRFYDPITGSITLDNTDLKDLKIQFLRSQIGIVSQETILFNTTIMQNLRLGNQHATKDDAIRAAKLANIHDFIMTLHKGYDTMVGERGVNLSGGQKQRLSIARTILKDPKIIILDEATSSLDSESELKIQEALDNVTKGRTTVIIAHRLSTIKNVDKIVVLKDHTIAEIGSFDDLMKTKGTFYNFYQAQFGRSKLAQAQAQILNQEIQKPATNLSKLPQ